MWNMRTFLLHSLGLHPSLYLYQKHLNSNSPHNLFTLLFSQSKKNTHIRPLFLYAFQFERTLVNTQSFWISYHDLIASTSKHLLCFTEFLTTFLSPGPTCLARPGRCFGAYRERLGWWRQCGGWNWHHAFAVGCIFRESGHRKGRINMESVSWLTAFTEPHMYRYIMIYPSSILYYHFNWCKILFIRTAIIYGGSGYEVEEIAFFLLRHWWRGWLKAG